MKDLFLKRTKNDTFYLARNEMFFLLTLPNISKSKRFVIIYIDDEKSTGAKSGGRKKEQVTRSDKIALDGRAGATKQHPHPNPFPNGTPPPPTNLLKKYLKRPVFPLFD